ncbi:MAG: efflux RND transporter periplasmic adaptor subunit [Bacillota bacterium]
MPRSAKFWLIFSGVLLSSAIIAAAVWRGLHGPATEVKVATAEERLFENKVLATGKVETTRQVEVVAPFAARLVSLKVKEGDRVAAGQVLGELDTADVEDRVREAEAALAAAEAELAAALTPGAPEEIAQAKAALEAGRAVADAAQKKLKRYRQLFDQEAASQAELEAAEMEYKKAQAEVASAEARLAALTKTDADTIAVHRARVEQARVSLENARRAVEKGRLTSPITGVVLQKAVKEGDYLQPGLSVLTIGDPGRLQVVVDLTEQEVSGVAPGREVEINWTGSPDKTWHGKVSRVAPAVTKRMERDTENTVRVYVALDKTGLLPGANVDTIIHRVKPHKALLVPTEAVVEIDKAKVVFAVEEGKARRHRVITGGSNELFTEIRSGLKPGAKVVLNPKDLKDGQPVRAGGAKH